MLTEFSMSFFISFYKFVLIILMKERDNSDDNVKREFVSSFYKIGIIGAGFTKYENDWL